MNTKLPSSNICDTFKTAALGMFGKLKVTSPTDCGEKAMMF